MGSTITEIQSEADFDRIVAKENVLIDFWAPWCGPCRQQAPILVSLAEKCEGRAVIAKVNVDDQPDLAARFRIDSIPTLLVFKNGEAVRRFSGVQSETVLNAALLG